MAHVNIKMDKKFKKDFAKWCKKRGETMNKAFYRMARDAMREDEGLDENGFDAATRAELDRRIADFKAGRNIVRHGLDEM